MFVNPGEKAKTLERLIKARKEVKSEQTGRVLQEAGFQEDTAKLFAPIVEGEKTSKEKVLKAITDGSEANRLGNLALTQAIREIESPLVPLFGGIDMPQLEGAEKGAKSKGERGEQIDAMLRSMLEETEDPEVDYERDRVKGITLKDGIVKLGNQPIHIKGDDINFEGKTYPKSIDLLELLIAKKPSSPDSIDDEVKEQYVQMLADAGLLYKRDGSRQGWKGKKYELIRDTIDKMMADGRIPRRKPKKGGALRQGRSGKAIDVVVGTAEELLDQLKLALASIQAGNTSNLLKNKAIAILDNLYQGKKLNKSTYIEALQQLN